MRGAGAAADRLDATLDAKGQHIVSKKRGGADI
jgi:hypothetical protein